MLTIERVFEWTNEWLCVYRWVWWKMSECIHIPIPNVYVLYEYIAFLPFFHYESVCFFLFCSVLFFESDNLCSVKWTEIDILLAGTSRMRLNPSVLGLSVCPNHALSRILMKYGCFDSGCLNWYRVRGNVVLFFDLVYFSVAFCSFIRNHHPSVYYNMIYYQYF